jgi:DNA replication initiation complex subunit (GINS family)
MNLTTEELANIWKQELTSMQLTELPVEFYSEATKLLLRLRSEIKGSEGLKREILAEELREAMLLLDGIYRTRLTKTMQGITSGEIPPGILERERTSLLEIRQRLEDLRREYFAGATAAELPVLLPSEPTHILVTFTTELREKIPGVDAKVYGPFRAGDVAYLPAQNAEIMIKHGLARKIEA